MHNSDVYELIVLVKCYSAVCSIFVHLNVYITGMSGKDTLSDAMLGGASDFMNDINTQLVTMRQAKDEDKVRN